MPQNNDLPDKKFPMDIHWDEVSYTPCIDSLKHLVVTLASGTSRDALLDYICEFTKATWEDAPGRAYSEQERQHAIEDMF